MEDTIEDLLEAYAADDRTIILVDNSDDEESAKYFLNSRRFKVLECKNLQTKRMVYQHTVYPVIEEVRQALVFSMKYGKTLVMRMLDCSADFVSSMCDENCHDRETENPHSPHQPWMTLPRGFMLRNGRLVRENADKFLRREDLREIRDGDCVKLHTNFKIIITTTLPASMIEDVLVNGKYGLPGTMDDYNIVIL